MEEAIGAIVDGAWTDAQAGAFLGALAAKGETVDELVGAARAMRARVRAGRARARTGRRYLRNAAATARRRSTSRRRRPLSWRRAACRSQSTAIGRPPAAAAAPTCSRRWGCRSTRRRSAARVSLERDRFAFLFAQRYHPAMKAIAPVRRELGVRTVFNLLGPLSNPARAEPSGDRRGRCRAPGTDRRSAAAARRGTPARSCTRRTGSTRSRATFPPRLYQFDGGGTRRHAIDPAAFGLARSAGRAAGRRPADERRRSPCDPRRRTIAARRCDRAERGAGAGRGRARR